MEKRNGLAVTCRYLFHKRFVILIASFWFRLYLNQNSIIGIVVSVAAFQNSEFIVGTESSVHSHTDVRHSALFISCFLFLFLSFLLELVMTYRNVVS